MIKLQAFTKNGSKEVYDELYDGVCFKLWAVRESVLRKAERL